MRGEGSGKSRAADFGRRMLRPSELLGLLARVESERSYDSFDFPN